ncbi:MAG: XRE family transcriptional regulator [Xanthobacteraceae bacterium]|nr:MAG: XRE family transcriptional regulator [Xanthobacteraceae bacterium]
MDGKDFDLGGRLRDIRQKAGLSQRELATRAGVPHGLIATIEQNKSSPSVASLRKVLDGLGISFVDFFTPARPAADRVFFEGGELVDLTSILPGTMTRGEGRMVFRQVGDAHANNLQILHERYEPGADTGEAMLSHPSREGGVVLSGRLEVTGAQARPISSTAAFRTVSAMWAKSPARW